MNILVKIKNFFAEVRAEMQKVTWPTREELVGSASVVLMTMLFLSVFIGATDFLMTGLLSLVLR